MRRVALGSDEDVHVGEILGSGLALPMPRLGNQDVELQETAAAGVVGYWENAGDRTGTIATQARFRSGTDRLQPQADTDP